MARDAIAWFEIPARDIEDCEGKRVGLHALA